MDGIAEKLAEIEKTARAIVENAEDQKHLQEKETCLIWNWRRKQNIRSIPYDRN